MNRLARASVALLAAWGAAFSATVPFQMAMCLRNSDGDMHAFRRLLPLVLAIWSVWTLALAVAGWLVVALPVALFVRPRWLYSVRWPVMVACTLIPVLATSLKFDLQGLIHPDTLIDWFDYGLYTALTVSYALTMGAVYFWLTGRFLRNESAAHG